MKSTNISREALRSILTQAVRLRPSTVRRAERADKVGQGVTYGQPRVGGRV
jgi:hypothetical protein